MTVHVINGLLESASIGVALREAPVSTHREGTQRNNVHIPQQTYGQGLSTGANSFKLLFYKTLWNKTCTKYTQDTQFLLKIVLVNKYTRRNNMETCMDNPIQHTYKKKLTSEATEEQQRLTLIQGQNPTMIFERINS